MGEPLVGNVEADKCKSGEQDEIEHGFSPRLIKSAVMRKNSRPTRVHRYRRGIEFCGFDVAPPRMKRQQSPSPSDRSGDAEGLLTSPAFIILKAIERRVVAG
jgi:hypothetical protein